MKVSSISSFNFNSNNVKFKRTAVPYPEYMNQYKNNTIEAQATNFLDKISALFSPSVSAESSKIKSTIDDIYSDKTSLENKPPKEQLLSVFG